MSQASNKEWKKRRRKRNFLLILWGLFLSPFLLLSIMLIRAANSDLPGFEQLEDPQTHLATQIISSDGKVLGKYFRKNRTRAEFEELSPHLVDALISTEDARYYQHSGIDIKALGRVAYGLLVGSKGTGGGSTISQQLAKLLFHKPPPSIWGRAEQKFKEWIIATRLERQYTKKEIIAMYLNKFDFLNNAVGIESASQVYFSKTPDSLNIQEAAMLVGMLKNPALFNPLKRPDTTKHRREIVLHQMLKNGKLSETEYDSLRKLPLGLNYQQVDHRKGLAPYFREHLRQKLGEIFTKKDEQGRFKYRKPDGSRYDIYSDGLKVYTTLNARMQKHAEKAMKRHLGEQLQGKFWDIIEDNEHPPFSDRVDQAMIQKVLSSAKKRTRRYKSLKTRGISEDSIDKLFNTPRKMEVFSWDGPIDTTMTPMDSIHYYKSFLRCGMISIEPKTGFVKTWVGGIDFEHFQYDHVAQGHRQAGSTFKPFVYATAIRDGYHPCKTVTNTPHCVEIPDQPDWCPQNANRETGGKYTLKYGLANSKNTITSYLMKQIGAAPIIKLAHDLGIKSEMDTVPSLGLGVADLSVKEMTSAHATIVNKGVHIDPILIERIEDKNGNIIYEMRPKTREALDERTSYIMLDLLKSVVDGAFNPRTGEKENSGTGGRIRYDRPYGRISPPVAAKTGTSQNNADGWFIGSTPELVTGIWVGAEDRSVRFGSLQTHIGQGANTSLPIWGYFMNRVYEDPQLDISTEDFEKPEDLEITLDCKKYLKKKGKGGEDPDWGS
ncbi:MAG: transglycosylase domain-containing protein [Flavobacteriales bacterium]